MFSSMLRAPSFEKFYPSFTHIVKGGLWIQYGFDKLIRAFVSNWGPENFFEKIFWTFFFSKNSFWRFLGSQSTNLTLVFRSDCEASVPRYKYISIQTLTTNTTMCIYFFQKCDFWHYAHTILINMPYLTNWMSDSNSVTPQTPKNVS